MAENEILDVKYLRHYRRFRAAIGDPKISPAEVAEIFARDFGDATFKALRGGPLHLVLLACGQDVNALRAAVDALNSRSLADIVFKVNQATGVGDAATLSKKAAQILCESVIDRAGLMMSKAEGMTGDRLLSIDNAIADLFQNGTRDLIATAIHASLTQKRLPRRARQVGHKPSVADVLSSSLTSKLRPTPNAPRA